MRFTQLTFISLWARSDKFRVCQTSPAIETTSRHCMGNYSIRGSLAGPESGALRPETLQTQDDELKPKTEHPPKKKLRVTDPFLRLFLSPPKPLNPNPQLMMRSEPAGRGTRV